MSDGKKLVSAILDAGSVETLRLIDRSLFEASEVGAFDFVVSHYRRYRELPTHRTVEAELRTRLPSADEAVGFYVKKVYDRNLFNELRAQFTDMREALQTFDVDACRAIVDRMSASCRLSTPDNDLRTIQEAGQEVLAEYDRMHENPGMSGITSGWPTLDLMTGGWQAGDLIALVARMGVGKTYAMIYMAVEARRAGYSVLFTTMEMTIAQIVRRVLAMETGITPEFLRKGMLSRYAERRLRNYVDTIAQAHKLNFYAGSFSKKLSDLDLVQAELTPDIHFVDGGYLVNPDDVPKNASRLDKVAGAFNGYKRMTITHNRPIVVSTQFSRAAGKRGKEGSLENISFSDAIAMNSSVVLGLKEGEPPYSSSRRELEVLKGREGESGKMNFNYKFAPMNFSEVAPDQVEAEAADLDWMG